MQSGRVRRHLGLRRRDDPADPGRARRPGQHDAAPELRQRLRRPEEPAPQHRRRRQLRRAPRPRPEPAGVQHRRRHDRPDELGLRSGKAARRTRARSASTTRRSSSPTRPLHLMTTQARARDQGPVPARRGAVRRGDRAAASSRSANQPTYWGTSTDQIDVVHRRRRRRRDDVAVPGQPAPGATSQPVDGDPARRGLDRLVRHLDDRRRRRQAPELHATSGWTT